MKNITARRDELKPDFSSGPWNELNEHSLSCWTMGFNACIIVLRPEIDKLVKALETEAQFLSMRGMIPLDKDHHILKALTKFKEFMDGVE